jgi:4-oxalocrotonate tautomerase
MPFVRIYVKEGVPAARRRAYGDAVHAALQATVNVPADDHFQVITSHADDLIYDPGFLGIARGEGIVFVQITLSFGRSVAQKQALFAAIADGLAAAGARREDAVVILNEVARENWSFGNGIAQYVVAPPPHLASGPAADPA